MPAKKLTKNVVVDGIGYGPDYPDTDLADLSDERRKELDGNKTLWEADDEGDAKPAASKR